MRIRSIKPEFWRSDDISALSRDDRLLFIGLWSYVDDNGVGRDQAPLIAADLFAQDLSIDPTETLGRVSSGLERLYNAGLITRYKAFHSGQKRDFLEVTKWADHQRIQNPGKPRYPRSEEGEPISTESLHSPSVETTEGLGPGAGEQGNRGAGNTPANPSHLTPSSKGSPAASDDAGQSIADEFEQWYAKYPRKKDRGHALKAFKSARKKTSLEKLMKGLDGYLVEIDRERTESRHVAYPATWLNGERWDDEDTQPPSRPAPPARPTANNPGAFTTWDENDFRPWHTRPHVVEAQERTDAARTRGEKPSDDDLATITGPNRD